MEEMGTIVRDLQQRLQTMNEAMTAQNAASVQSAAVYEARLIELREVAVSAAGPVANRGSWTPR
eukprot:10235480-Heterocapsa_arctica.AAC.1